MRDGKFSFSRSQCNDCTGNRGNEVSGGEDGECMKTIAKETRGEAK